MKIVFGMIVLLAFGCSQKLNNNNKSNESFFQSLTEPAVASFFEGVGKGEAAQALVQLFKSNPNIPVADSSTLAIINKVASLSETSGEYLGHNLLKKRFINSDLAAYSYLVKYEKKFFRFVFIFYNNNREVRLYKFQFDDTLDVEVEESLKLYMD